MSLDLEMSSSVLNAFYTRKPGLNGPLRGDIYPDTGGVYQWATSM